MSNERTPETLTVLYQENAKVAAIFWEWRHKVIIACFAGIAALFALAGWFYQQPTLRVLLWIPLFIGALLPFVSLLLDQRNAKILKGCYLVGKQLEHELNNKGAIFEQIGKHSGATYTLILGVVYVVVGVLLLFISFWAVRLVR